MTTFRYTSSGYTQISRLFAYLVTVCVEVVPHFHAERMMQHFEYLKLSVFVSFVLKHLFDGYCLTRLCYNGFEHHTKGAVSNDLLSIISKALLGLES